MTSTEEPALLLHVVYRFAVGGLENGVVNLINHLPQQHWRHGVVSLTDVDAAFARRIQRSDVDIVALHKPPGHAITQYPALWRLFRRLKPSIVHTRNLAALEAQLPAFFAGVPARIHGEHGRDVDDLHGTRRKHVWLRRLYRPFVQHTVALGRELADYSRQRIGVPQHRLSTIYNGVDTARFHPAAPREPIAGCPFGAAEHWLVGSVGRLQAVKAQTVLAQAFVRLLQQQPQLRARLRLVLVGEGALRDECQHILQSGGVAGLAWFAGERADVPEVMRGLDCFVLPSLAEGISNTILEAMASGLPVLATRVGANAELVLEGASGLLVPAGDAAALASGMATLAGNPAQAAAMGRLGRDRVLGHFSLQAMVGAYESVYRQALRLNPRSV